MEVHLLLNQCKFSIMQKLFLEVKYILYTYCASYNVLQLLSLLFENGSYNNTLLMKQNEFFPL